MLTDALAIAALVALVLGWLAAQRLASRHGSPQASAFRCGACSGDCGGSRPDCPRSRLPAHAGANGIDEGAGIDRDRSG